MPTLHLIEGPIGAGKSTYAGALSERIRAPWLCLDDWVARLYIPDRPPGAGVDWYLERKARCEAQIWQVATDIVASGNDVILELGLVTREARERFYNLVENTDATLLVYVLDAPLETRRERVKMRNLEHGDTWSMDITSEMFERSSGWWEPPDDAEYEHRTLIPIDTA